MRRSAGPGGNGAIVTRPSASVNPWQPRGDCRIVIGSRIIILLMNGGCHGVDPGEFGDNFTDFPFNGPSGEVMRSRARPSITRCADAVPLPLDVTSRDTERSWTPPHRSTVCVHTRYRPGARPVNSARPRVLVFDGLKNSGLGWTASSSQTS